MSSHRQPNFLLTTLRFIPASLSEGNPGKGKKTKLGKRSLLIGGRGTREGRRLRAAMPYEGRGDGPAAL